MGLSHTYVSKSNTCRLSANLAVCKCDSPSFSGGTVNEEFEQEGDLGQSRNEPRLCLMLPLQTALAWSWWRSKSNLQNAHRSSSGMGRACNGTELETVQLLRERWSTKGFNGEQTWIVVMIISLQRLKTNPLWFPEIPQEDGAVALD